jgi:hypothetical protein
MSIPGIGEKSHGHHQKRHPEAEKRKELSSSHFSKVTHMV